MRRRMPDDMLASGLADGIYPSWLRVELKDTSSSF